MTTLPYPTYLALIDEYLRLRHRHQTRGGTLSLR